MIWGILIVLIVVCLGFLAWLFCIAPASPRGDFAEMNRAWDAWVPAGRGATRVVDPGQPVL